MPMKISTLAAALVIALGASADASAKGTPGGRGAAPAQVSIEGNPLTINIGDDHAFQVYNSTIGSAGQIYPSGSGLADMGWLVRIGSSLTAPDFGNHIGGSATGGIGTYTAFANRSVSAVTGAGTAASPYSVTVQGSAGGLAATDVVTYVNGENFFRKALTLQNPGSAPITARVFLGSDIYLASSDDGTPYREPTSGSPGGQTCAGITPVYTILHIPTGLAPSSFTADSYSGVWSQIGAGALDGAVDPGTCIDNGAALQWDVTVPAGGSTTITAATSFGAIPVIVGPPPADAVAAPTMGAWGLAALAIALLALAGVALRRNA